MVWIISAFSVLFESSYFVNKSLKICRIWGSLEDFSVLFGFTRREPSLLLTSGILIIISSITSVMFSIFSSVSSGTSGIGSVTLAGRLSFITRSNILVLDSSGLSFDCFLISSTILAYFYLIFYLKYTKNHKSI